MDEIGIVLSERKNTGFALWSLLNIEIMDRDRERRRCIVVGQRRRSMPLERKDDRSTCRMQERVFDNALPISAAYVIAGLNRSIIRAHWSGPRLFLSAEEYPRYVISVRGIVIMYFVWNTARIDIRWIELMGFAYEFLISSVRRRKKLEIERKMDGKARTILSSIFDCRTFYARWF